MSEFLGIARERIFSPGKVAADRAILDAVADVLRERGHGVRVVSAEDELPRPSDRATVFTMSQGGPALATLREWERDAIRVVNSVDSILSCHRHRLLQCLERAGVRTPETILLSDGTNGVPQWLDVDGGWLKRGDVHATEASDVVFVRDGASTTAALAGFRARGIGQAVLQRHVPGIVIKFYGVGDGFLACFPGVEAPLALPPSRAAALHRLARAGAAALGLEVYGGDCVVDLDGELQLIDLNDWPSYSPCRAAAARAIAGRLEVLSEGSR
jgi:hypothetical protein